MASFNFDKLSSILTTLLTVETQAANTIPVLHVGTAGEVIGISILAEETLLGVIGALKSANIASVPVMMATQTPPVAPTA